MSVPRTVMVHNRRQAPGRNPLPVMTNAWRTLYAAIATRNTPTTNKGRRAVAFDSDSHCREDPAIAGRRPTSIGETHHPAAVAAMQHEIRRATGRNRISTNSIALFFGSASILCTSEYGSQALTPGYSLSAGLCTPRPSARHSRRIQDRSHPKADHAVPPKLPYPRLAARRVRGVRRGSVRSERAPEGRTAEAAPPGAPNEGPYEPPAAPFFGTFFGRAKKVRPEWMLIAG